MPVPSTPSGDGTPKANPKTTTHPCFKGNLNVLLFSGKDRCQFSKHPFRTTGVNPCPPPEGSLKALPHKIKDRAAETARHSLFAAPQNPRKVFKEAKERQVLSFPNTQKERKGDTAFFELPGKKNERHKSPSSGKEDPKRRIERKSSSQRPEHLNDIPYLQVGEEFRTLPHNLKEEGKTVMVRREHCKRTGKKRIENPKTRTYHNELAGSGLRSNVPFLKLKAHKPFSKPFFPAYPGKAHGTRLRSTL
jgi:hypothetical protein